MFTMKGTIVTQITEKVLSRVEVEAYDNRTRKIEQLTLYIELTEQEQEEKPIIERACSKLGYTLIGWTHNVTTSVPFNAETMWHKGKHLEKMSGSDGNAPND